MLVALIGTSALAGLAAASSPFLRAGVASESLRGEVRLFSPLAAGLEIRSGGRPRFDGDRREAAVRFAGGLRFVGRPVLASMVGAEVAGIGGNGLQVVAMARTGGLRHVRVVGSAGGDGVWISTATAKGAGLRAGGLLRLTGIALPGEREHVVVRLRIAGVYRALDQEIDNPYWANFVQDIRRANPDAPPPPAFVLMSEPELVRVAHAVRAAVVENRFEYPVDPSSVTFTGALRLATEFAAVRRELARPRSELARQLGCGGRVVGKTLRCAVHSPLDAALVVAARNVAAVAPTISLLSGFGLAIAVATTFAAGLMGIRRRVDEVGVLYARGASPLVFAARTGLEAFLPILIGSSFGYGFALLGLRVFAAAGTIDGGTVMSGGERAMAAAGVLVVTVGAGALLAFPRRERVGDGWLRLVERIPWEVVPFAVVLGLAVLLHTRGGLARDVNGNTHPSLVVFLLPLFLGAGVSGLAVRGFRRVLARRAGSAPPQVFLAVRRLAAARTLLVAVIVSGAVGFGALAYALTLSRSLERSAAEKAFVANGSDVQGIVDTQKTPSRSLPFPVALVEVDSFNVSLPGGQRVDLIAGEPTALGRTILWRSGWGNDPRPLLPRLADEGPSLAAIATPGTSSDAIIDQGARIPIRIVGHADIPGMTADRPALLVSHPLLAKTARRLGIIDPAPGAGGLLWARGSPSKLEPVLEASDLAPFFLTTPSHIRENGSVVAAERSYTYVRTIGAAAGVLALLSLLLYLQARQRSQRIASALAARMGLGFVGDATALALEAGLAVLFAVTVGGLVAVAAARPLVARVDPLPLYAPSPVAVIPWMTLAGTAFVATIVGMVFGVAAAVVATRSDVAEALRVA